jgi:hypothetical protein
MLKNTLFTVDKMLIETATLEMPNTDQKKFSINQPTGNFFYDSWTLKDNFKNTVWEAIYNSLSVEDKGEARIIELGSNENYSLHADIDDRYHLNISGTHSYLIDLTTNTMYPQTRDGIWYEMDASRIHTAANFSNQPRLQLVVRKLLKRVTDKTDFINIVIKTTHSSIETARFLFDNSFSPYLNLISKKQLLFNFNYTSTKVELDIHKSCLEDLKKLCGDYFIIEF